MEESLKRLLKNSYSPYSGFRVAAICLMKDGKSFGGVNIENINPKTMESTITDDLYFAGEVLEPVGPTGGYNLKIAFSTGCLAGLSASKE